MQVIANPLAAQAAAPVVSVSESHDVADHAARMNGWTMKIDQFSSGPFRGHVVELRLRNMQVIRERTAQTLMKQGAAWPGALVFSLPIEASGDGYVNGHVLSFPNPVLSDGSDLPALLTPKFLDVVTVAVGREWFVGHLRDLGEFTLADCLVAGGEGQLRLHLTWSEIVAMQGLFRQLFEACEHPATAPELNRSPDIVEQLVLQTLIDALTVGHRIPLNSATRQKRIADRARDYAFANLDHPPSIAALCRHVGISRRSLQGCFQGAFGIAPSQFLRAARLNAVRRELRTLVANGHRVAIGDVAAKWGFWHWSRFSRDYRTLFGELPSQTAERIGGAASKSPPLSCGLPIPANARSDPFPRFSPNEAGQDRSASRPSTEFPSSAGCAATRPGSLSGRQPDRRVTAWSVLSPDYQTHSKGGIL